MHRFPLHSAMDKTFDIIRLPGYVPYADALRLQYERRAAVEAGQALNAIFLLEHAPVITLGRSAHAENLLLSREELLRRGIAVHDTDRGGDVTYHGPGQMVAYPILNLTIWNLAIWPYLRSLEDVLIRQLTRYGLDAGRMEGLTGVWVNGAKVAAIGIGVHHTVTFHGVALNVNPDMEHFRYIVPCGIGDKPVASLASLLPATPSMDQAMDDFVDAFADVFQARARR
ncbi:MAG TPA: lipoyl(octanoyl) transferase LipB [Candidatus Hydrogenedentes bacterium]|nr:lipoyl(octanoyl) transferase LipB [Candidatus Hydrogenedentota bacterium]HRT19329.1 lipoyl(octanoyl) transferase LipB [Candidatus Hydrogenedentota bacterium]HRT63409.1 lipoyl(octanoyl) transferase LipB [Candidatus Hydrogenedentota bacterium]